MKRVENINCTNPDIEYKLSILKYGFRIKFGLLSFLPPTSRAEDKYNSVYNSWKNRILV